MFFKKVVHKLEKQFASTYPAWSSRHINRLKVEKYYKNSQDLLNALNRIILIDKAEFDKLYKNYCADDKLFSLVRSATDDLVDDVNKILTSGLLPGKIEKEIAKAICSYLADPVNHELGFCSFLLTERMTSLQNCSARLVAIMQNEQKGDAKQENPSHPTATTPKAADNAVKTGSKTTKPADKPKGLRINVDDGFEQKVHLKEAETPRP